MLSRDALELAEWFYTHPSRDRWLHLSLGHAAKDGPTRPLDVCDTDGITSPWAWAFTRDAWSKMRECWNSKAMPPKGWDWSLSYNMAKNSWWGAHPYFSRAFNIGRMDGVNGTPEWWDEHWRDVPVSDGSCGVQFHECGPWDPSIPRLRDWMREEVLMRGDRIL